MRISWSVTLVTIELLASCGGSRASTPIPEALSALPAVAPDRVWLLESPGVPPEDTTVTFAPGSTRVILLRRGAPDNTLFAELHFPAGSITPPVGNDSIQISVHPRPGLYAIDVETSAAIGTGAELRFVYAVHFTMPSGARDRYHTELGFESALHIGFQRTDGQISLLASSRPGSDLLAAPLRRAGRYLVGAPR